MLAPTVALIPLLRILQAARAQVGAQAHLQLRIVGDGPERTRIRTILPLDGTTEPGRFEPRYPRC